MDFRETPSQPGAMGLLKLERPDARGVCRCVQKAAAQLQKNGFYTAKPRPRT